MFVKLRGVHLPARKDRPTSAHVVTWVNINWIEEVTAGPTVYKQDDESKIDYCTTHVYVGGSSGINEFESRFILHEKLTKVMERINKAIEAGKACCDPEHDEDNNDMCLNDRGVWLPGESYVRLDVVGHPDDVSDKYMAVASSKSTSVLVLANNGYWCRL